MERPNIRCPLNETATINQNHPACIEQNRVLFYPQLDAATEQVMLHLRDRGVTQGDVLLVEEDAQWRWIPLVFACLRLGVLLAPVNPQLPDAAMARVKEELSPILSLGRRGDLRLEKLCELLSSASPGPHVTYALEQPATILQSSGTTGSGKLLMHTVEAHYYAALGANQHLPPRNSTCWLLSLPLYHAGGFGILFRCVMTGSTLALPKRGEDLGEEILLLRATHLSLVPTQLRQLLQHPDAKEIAAQLKCVLLGGAPCPDDLLQEAQKRGFPIHKTYGLTETLGQVTTVPAPATPTQQAQNGVLLPYRELSVDPKGEIRVRGEVLAAGTWKKGVLSELDLDEGWYPTGDLGSMDEEHGLKVSGRRDHQFVSGGENIVPEEIEAVLLRLLDCNQAIVVDVPCETFGRRSLAFLDIPASEIVGEQIVDALRAELPAYKIPRHYFSLPETETLKVSRAELRKQAEKWIST